MDSKKRTLIKGMLCLPLLAKLSLARPDEMPVLKEGYRRRLKRLLASGGLPYIDIESSCNASKVDIATVAGDMDSLGIGLMALSSDIGRGQFEKGVVNDHFYAKLLAAFPAYFIPIGNGGQAPALTESTDAFFDGQEQDASSGHILSFGEYELRHYSSPRQVKRGEMDRDVSIPIDGPIGQRLFSMSERTGVPFQIHYEIEDALLPPLEEMLGKYPKAKVVWCHLAQIRYIERASHYSAAYVEGLIKRFPNLHFDTAFGDAGSIYPLSNQHHSRVWSGDGALKQAWVDLIVAYPSRFLSALDLGGDRMSRIAEYDRKHRNFLDRLPVEARHQVAYRSAWQLLFNEEFA